MLQQPRRDNNLLLHSAPASCGAVYCNRSCLCVCGRAGGVRTLPQPARAQCLRLSERFFHLNSFCDSTKLIRFFILGKTNVMFCKVGRVVYFYGVKRHCDLPCDNRPTAICRMFTWPFFPLVINSI